MVTNAAYCHLFLISSLLCNVIFLIDIKCIAIAYAEWRDRHGTSSRKPEFISHLKPSVSTHFINLILLFFCLNLSKPYQCSVVKIKRSKLVRQTGCLGCEPWCVGQRCLGKQNDSALGWECVEVAKALHNNDVKYFNQLLTKN